MQRQIIEAEWTWTGRTLEPGVQIAIDERGRIESVGHLGAVTTKRLARRALLPGFVNAHSHAFQRGLRGLGETYPVGQGDFWSWREAMYDLVLRVTPAEMKRLCRQAFDEMLSCGFTTVGEFHYLHHSNIGATSGDESAGDFAFDEIVLEAAVEAGIRIVLLQSYYKTGAMRKPLAGGQRRFATPDVETFLRHVDATANKLRGDTQSLGLAPHSLRAVPPDDLVRLHRAAVERAQVCHIHVEEQRKEVEESLAALGRTPLEWMLESLGLGPRDTIIHATHSTPDNLRRYIASGANICVCPITEGNLGDGLGDVATMLERADAVCIGTDSNVRIDAAEELRWLEFVRRLKHERRGICRDETGDIGRQLLRCGSENGARALGIRAGRVESGYWADFAAIELESHDLSGANAETAVAAFLFGSSGAAVREVCVGGRWVR
jgi:formimidoylglutamate deiminase